MADNLKLIKEDIDTYIDPNGGVGSVLALNHNAIEKSIVDKVGKYVGSAFTAVKTATIFTSGVFSWQGNAMNNTSNFTIRVSKKTSDLNDFGLLLDTLTENDIIQFKDFVGRCVYLKFISFTAGTDGSGNPIYDIIVAGYADNPNYTYQVNENEICILSLNKQLISTEHLAPKESPNLTGIPTAPTAPVGTNTTQIATTEFVLANAVSNNFAPAVCFTFDDSYLSQYNLLAVPFETRGVRFSQGVTFSYLGNTGMMSTAQVLDLEARGFEVLNHTATHLDLRDGTASTYANAISEISGGHTSLVGLGMTPKGFISAYSAVKREFLPIIDSLYDNAYTISHGIGAGIANPDIQVMNAPIYALKMNRASLYQHNVAQCKAIIDRAVATNGVVTFYDHDPNGVYYATSASVSDILEVVDYAIASVGVNNVIKSSEIPSRFSAVKTGGGVYVDFKTSQSFPNVTFTATELNYAVESIDIKADANGTFTVKTSGTYNIEGSWYIGSATTVRMISAIEIDGTGVYRNRHNGYGSLGVTSTQSYVGIMACAITLVKGQTFKLLLYQDSGASKTIQGGVYDYAKITKVS